MLLLLVAEIGFFVYLASREPEPAATDMRPNPTPSDRRVVNDQAGFILEPPEGWDQIAAGVTSSFESPDGDAVMSIGPGPDGTAFEVLEDLQDLVADSYRNVRVIDTGFTTFGLEPAETATGVATNEAGARLRFTLAAVETPGQTFAVTIFSASDRQAPERIRMAEKALGSFALASSDA